jgi:hypothetical protein
MVDPPEAFRVSMILSDSAQVTNGKLYLLGGGWNVTHPLNPGAVAGIVMVPWNETNRKHVLEFRLYDNAGQNVKIGTPQGPQDIFVKIQFEVGRPPGVRQGMTFSNPVSFSYGLLPLVAGQTYEWRWKINDITNSEWRLTFDVVAPPGQKTI